MRILYGLALAVLLAETLVFGNPWPGYEKSTAPAQYDGLAYRDLPGFTRSTVRRNYALIAPESQVFSKNPLLENGVSAHLVSPAMGANFAMYYARLEFKGRLSSPKDPSIERFIVCLDGSVEVAVDVGTSGSPATKHVVNTGEFGYMPANSSHVIVNGGKDQSTLLVFERQYMIKGVNPASRFGVIEEQEVLPVAPEVFTLRKLMPDTEEYDFNIHVMDFRPGEHLHIKEVHYNQHGLLLVAGKGIYRLGDDWYPVKAGDAIWMAPFVPQWYAALGSEPSRYILYKDTTVDPVHGH
jgi:(S)-ureidoglycine aminohydrolase